MSGVSFDKSYGGNPAENYERFFVPAIGEPLARDLVDRMRIRSSDRVLDVACGTGIVARLVARTAAAPGSVAGLDPNGGMLAVARTVTPASAGIEWYDAPAEQMPLADAAFDVVVCQMGLQFMADPPAALAEMRRVLADGGRVWLGLPGPATGLFAALARSMERHVGPHAEEFVLKVFSLHDSAAIEGLLHGAGFRALSIEATTMTLELPPPRDFVWQYIYSTPLGGVVSQASADARAALERDVLAAWKEFEHGGTLRHDLRMVFATGTRTEV